MAAQLSTNKKYVGKYVIILATTFYQNYIIKDKIENYALTNQSLVVFSEMRTLRDLMTDNRISIGKMTP